MWDQSRGRLIMAHRIAWESAYGPIPDGLEVCHHCDNPPCVRPDHLFLGTHLENMQDAATKGRMKRDVTRHVTKLSPDDIRCIRKESASGVMNRDLATRYDVDPSVISKIIHGHRWGHIE